MKKVTFYSGIFTFILSPSSMAQLQSFHSNNNLPLNIVKEPGSVGRGPTAAMKDLWPNLSSP